MASSAYPTLYDIHPLSKTTPYGQRREDYLDISQFFKSQTLKIGLDEDIKQPLMIHPEEILQNQTIQAETEQNFERLQFEKDVKQHEEDSTRIGLVETDKTEEKGSKKTKTIKKERKVPSKKHNFTKNLIGKLKTVVKNPNFLGLKKGGKLQNLRSLTKTYWYLFHETIKQTETIQTLRQFLATGAQFKFIDEFKKMCKEQEVDEEDIDLIKINQLRKELREKIISSNLLELAQNTQKKEKQAFVSQVQQFIDDLGLGQVKLQHK